MKISIAPFEVSNLLSIVGRILTALILVLASYEPAHSEPVFGFVSDSLKGPPSFDKMLLQKTADLVVKVRGGAGLTLLRDEDSGLELIVSVAHIFNRRGDDTLPIEDVQFATYQPSNPRNGISSSEYGHRPIDSDWIGKPPRPGSQVTVLGYGDSEIMTYTVGQVMTDSEARETQQGSREETGGLMYNPEIEYFVKGVSRGGMSGGPAFNSNKEWIGTLIRGGSRIDPKTGRKDFMFRVLKPAFMLAKFKEALELADPQERAQLSIFSERIFKMATNNISASVNCGSMLAGEKQRSDSTKQSER
jgi:hypothetical protein